MLQYTANKDILDKYKPPDIITYQILQGTRFINKKHEVKYYFCKRGDELVLISESLYNYKDGKFYTVRNKANGALFTIDEKDVDIIEINEDEFFVLH